MIRAGRRRCPAAACIRWPIARRASTGRPTRVDARASPSVRPPRRGRWELGAADPPAHRSAAPAHRRASSGRAAGSVLVLPRIEPVIVRAGRAAAAATASSTARWPGRGGARRRGRSTSRSTGCAPTARGARASRIHWPTVARSRRDARAPARRRRRCAPRSSSSTRATRPTSRRSTARFGRRPRSACTWRRSRGCALLLAGERAPRQIDRQLRGVAAGARPAGDGRGRGGPPPGSCGASRGAGGLLGHRRSRDAPRERALAGRPVSRQRRRVGRRRRGVHGGGLSRAARSQAPPAPEADGGGAMTDARLAEPARPA